jgi:methionyl-tRNA formyltransferase
MGNMKTVFLGTAWESLETLKVLHNDPNFEIVSVITTPDKPVGRKQTMTPSDVKKYAMENGIPVVHTEGKTENYVKVLKKYEPEIVVCKAFGEIVPKEFLEYPKYGCINIHFSILPKYRGAVPIQKAILDGEKETGISIMLMSEGLDEGDVLEIFREKIRNDDTNVTLRERLVKKSTEVLIPTLLKWINGEIEEKAQKNEEATYCWQRDISKEKAEILWDEYTPEYIERMVRALVPWPIAWTVLGNELPKSIAGKKVKIFEAELVNIPSEKDAGELFSKEGMVLFSTQDPLISLRIKSFQLEGRNKNNENEFLNGIGRELSPKS